MGIVGVGLLPCSEPPKGLESVPWTEGMACTEAVRWEHCFCVCMYPQTPVSKPTPWCDGVWGRIGKIGPHGIKSQCLHWFCVCGKHLMKAGEGRRDILGSRQRGSADVAAGKSPSMGRHGDGSAWHTQSGSTERTPGAQLTVSSLLSQGLQPVGWCYPHSGHAFPSLLNFLETSSQTRPAVCSS